MSLHVGDANLFHGHNSPESLKGGCGSVVHCNKGVPQVGGLIDPCVANVVQVLSDLLDNLNGLK